MNTEAESFQHPEEFHQSIRDAEFDFWIHNLKESTWTITHLDVEHVHIQYGMEGAGAIADGVTRIDGWVFFMQMAGQRTQANGEQLRAGTAFAVAPGDQFSVASSSAHEWFSVFVPNGLLVDSSQSFEEFCNVGTESRLIRLTEKQTEQVHRFSKLLHDGEDQSVNLEDIVEIAQDLLRTPTPHRKTAGRRPSDRRELITQVLHAIETDVDMNPDLEILLAATGVSERTLRTAIGEHFGISPVSFVILRRLHAARSLLRNPPSSTTTVTQIALQFGFTDTGRFSGRYKHVFGEFPSATLERANR